MREYARITGLPEMPPLWTFGYLQSHRTLAGPDEVKWVAKTMREKKLPCDALIYLGTDFTPSGWNTHNGEFTWNAKNFPDPKAMIDELHAEHFKVVLHIVVEAGSAARPGTLKGSVSDPCTAAPLPPGRTPDGQWPPDRQASCYWPAHKPLYDLGIDGWWPDQGDGFDGPSELARIRMYWEGSQQWRPNERPFALHRNGYAGDVAVRRVSVVGRRELTWETLKTHVPDGVNTGALRHSVLGHGHRRLHADGRVHGRAARALVPVRRILSALPRARTRLASAPAVGMEHGRARPERSGQLPRRRPRRSSTTPTSSRSAASTSSCGTG